MDAINSIKNRVSLRSYAKKQISLEHENIIIESAIKAPTACNMMLYSIIKVKSAEMKKKLCAICNNQPFIDKASLVLIFNVDVQKWFDYFKISGVEEYVLQKGMNFRKPSLTDFMLGFCDALIAAQNSVIAAESLGIGSCYTGDVLGRYEELIQLLELPEYVVPAAMLAYGYYPDNYRRKEMKRFDKKYVVSDEKYLKYDEKMLKSMFEQKEWPDVIPNPFEASNFAEFMYMFRINSEFSITMHESLKKIFSKFEFFE